MPLDPPIRRSIEGLGSAAPERLADFLEDRVSAVTGGGGWSHGLVARVRGVPLPRFQLLDMPCLDLTLSSPSVEEQGHPGFDRGAIGEWVGDDLGGTVEPSHPRVSPLFEPDLRGLPPALVP